MSATHLIIRGLRDLAGMELPGIELRPELPRAVPITMKRDDGGYDLVGLRFDSSTGAADFANGLGEVCCRDGEQVFLKKPPPITQDAHGNCAGVN